MLGKAYLCGHSHNQTYQVHYDYDRWGNRFQYQQNTNLSYTTVQPSEITASTNRFISSGQTPIQYDAAGNITTDQKFRGMNYSYDANNRQTLAEKTDHTQSQTSVYDGAGQRVQTTVNSITQQMVYDAFGQLIAEYTNGSLSRENIYRGGQLLATNESPSPQSGAQNGGWTNAAGGTGSNKNINKKVVYGWGTSCAV